MWHSVGSSTGSSFVYGITRNINVIRVTVNDVRSIQRITFGILSSWVIRYKPRFSWFLQESIHTSAPSGFCSLRFGFYIDIDAIDLCPSQSILVNFVIINLVFIVILILPHESILVIQCWDFSTFRSNDRDTDIVTIFTRTNRCDNQLVSLVRYILFNITITWFVIRFNGNCITIFISFICAIQDFGCSKCSHFVNCFRAFFVFLCIFLPRNNYTIWLVSSINGNCCWCLGILFSNYPEQIFVITNISCLRMLSHKFKPVFFINYLFYWFISNVIIFIIIYTFPDIIIS